MHPSYAFEGAPRVGVHHIRATQEIAFHACMIESLLRQRRRIAHAIVYRDGDVEMRAEGERHRRVVPRHARANPERCQPCIEQDALRPLDSCPEERIREAWARHRQLLVRILDVHHRRPGNEDRFFDDEDATCARGGDESFLKAARHPVPPQVREAEQVGLEVRVVAGGGCRHGRRPREPRDSTPRSVGTHGDQRRRAARNARWAPVVARSSRRTSNRRVSPAST